MPWELFLAVSWGEQVTFRWDNDDGLFGLDQHAELDFYSINALKQQSTDRHVTPLKTYYADSEPSCLCSCSLIIHAWLTEKQQVPIV
jgi:hypothetical protein